MRPAISQKPNILPTQNKSTFRKLNRFLRHSHETNKRTNTKIRKQDIHTKKKDSNRRTRQTKQKTITRISLLHGKLGLLQLLPRRRRRTGDGGCRSTGLGGGMGDQGRDIVVILVAQQSERVHARHPGRRETKRRNQKS